MASVNLGQHSGGNYRKVPIKELAILSSSGLTPESFRSKNWFLEDDEGSLESLVAPYSHRVLRQPVLLPTCPDTPCKENSIGILS